MTVLLGEIDSNLHTVDQRGAERFSVTLGLWAPEKAQRALIYNLSRCGMLLRVERELREGEQIELALPGAGATRATIVRVEDVHVYGCEFDAPISKTAVEAALLQGGYGPNEI